MSLTIEEKAAAFDKLCEMLQGKGQYSHATSVPVVRTSSACDSESTAYEQPMERRVEWFKFVLISPSSDFKWAMEALAKGRSL